MPSRSPLETLAKLAIGVIILASAALLPRPSSDNSADPSPVARQLREQVEALQLAAGIAVDRSRCRRLHKFVPARPVYYECVVAESQLDPIRSALLAEGWQVAAPTAEPGFAFVKEARLARLSCVPASKECRFRIELAATAPRS